MTFTDLLINTCTILEDTGVAPDAYGNVTPSWTAVAGLSDISCRVSTPSTVAGREVTVGAEVVVADYKLFLGDVAVTEQNRVRSDGIDYEVLLVSDRQDGTGSHHKECWLRVVR